MSTPTYNDSTDLGFRKRFVSMCGTANPSVIADMLGVSYTAARNYLNGRLPETKLLIRISEQSEISLHWLLTGEGDKYVDRSRKTEAEMLASVLSEFADASVLRKVFETLSEELIKSSLKSSGFAPDIPKVKTIKLHPDKIKQERKATLMLEKDPVKDR